MNAKVYDTVTIFVLPHPVVADSFALSPVCYFGDEYDLGDSQEYRGLDVALSQAVSLAELYESEHPNASVVVIDNRGTEYPRKRAA